MSTTQTCSNKLAVHFRNSTLMDLTVKTANKLLLIVSLVNFEENLLQQRPPQPQKPRGEKIGAPNRWEPGFRSPFCQLAVSWVWGHSKDEGR